MVHNTDEALSEAGRLNKAVLRKLQRAFSVDPECDLLSVLPWTYAARLAWMTASRQADEQSEIPKASGTASDAKDTSEQVEWTFSPDDIRSFIRPSEPISILYPLSEQVATKLGALDAHISFNDLSKLLHEFEVVWKGPFPSTRAVFRLGPDINIKAVYDSEDLTEYTTLHYLERNAPKIPAPRSLGTIRIGRVHLLFMSCIPGTTLRETWRHLSRDQKVDIQEQLDWILSELRQLCCPKGTPLGGVAGEGCKDLHRSIRCSREPISTAIDFERFQFSNPIYGSNIYINFLRSFSQAQSSRCVFTRGDVRPDNIMVDLANDGQYLVTGIIDWELADSTRSITSLPKRRIVWPQMRRVIGISISRTVFRP